MSYYDWPHLIKPLTWKPVQQDTSFKKATQFAPVSDVGTKLIKIQIPAATFTTLFQGGGNGQCPPVIIGQICFSFPNAFTFLRYGQDVFLQMRPAGSRISIAVRYRVGNIVVRYALCEEPVFTHTPIYAPAYAGQIIKPNFVLEIWQVIYSPFTQVSTNSLELDTGIIYIPINDEDAGPVVGASATIDLPALTNALPETLPITPAANGPWLTN